MEPSPGARGGEGAEARLWKSPGAGGECVGTRFWGVWGVRPGTLNPGP